MFGRKRRAQAHAIEQLRADLRAECHARDAQLVALQASLLRAIESASVAQHCEVDGLRMSVERSTAEVAALLGQLAQTYAALIDSLDVARADRTGIAQVLQQLVEATQPAPRAIASHPRLPHERVLDLSSEDHDAARIGTEVWCRYQDRWIGGFEIAETVDNGRELHYRIRRTTDGYILPTLFSPDDVRAAKRVL